MRYVVRLTDGQVFKVTAGSREAVPLMVTTAKRVPASAIASIQPDTEQKENQQ